MKTLIVLIHPDLSQSVINKRWIQELEKHPDKFHIHDLHRLYPDEKIDVQKEQRLIEQYDRIIFQFPYYWFSSPPLFKKWQDEVLTYGWAYGSKSGYKMKDKKVALAIAAGIDEKEYTPEGRYKYTLQQLTAPFEITFQYVRANYQPLFAFYGAEHHARPERIEAGTEAYLAFLEAFRQADDTAISNLSSLPPLFR